MDKTTAIVLTLAILSLVFIAFFAVFRKSGKGKINGPFGIGLEVVGSNASQETHDEKKAEKLDSFEIEGISLQMASYPRYVCQVRVHNRTLKTADHVRIELIDMENSVEKSERHWLPSLPLILLPEQTTDQITINPGGSLTFNLFKVTKHKSAHAPDLHIWHHYVIAKFSVGLNDERAALFKNNQDYLFKFKITARDFPPTEPKLNLNFTGEESSCCFTLTPR